MKLLTNTHPESAPPRRQSTQDQPKPTTNQPQYTCAQRHHSPRYLGPFCSQQQLSSSSISAHLRSMLSQHRHRHRRMRALGPAPTISRDINNVRVGRRGDASMYLSRRSPAAKPVWSAEDGRRGLRAAPRTPALDLDFLIKERGALKPPTISPASLRNNRSYAHDNTNQTGEKLIRQHQSHELDKPLRAHPRYRHVHLSSVVGLISHLCSGIGPTDPDHRSLIARPPALIPKERQSRILRF